MAKVVHYLDLLGLAINGLLKSYRMESCTPKEAKVQKSKIVGITRGGEEIETECVEYQRIVRTWIIIKHYEKWNKHMIVEGSKEATINADLEDS